MTDEDDQVRASDSGGAGDEREYSHPAITLRTPSNDALASGVLLQFDWTDPAGSRGNGDIKRGAAGLVITRMEVSAPEPSGITRNLVRAMPIAAVLDIARTHLIETDQLYKPPGSTPVQATPGYTHMTDDLLRDVALAYLEETAPGKDRGATRRMVERFGRPQGTVQSWIKRARKEGWLTPGPSGRMGAEPGPKLRAWIVETSALPIKPGGPSSTELFTAALDKLGGLSDERVARRLIAAMSGAGNWPERQAGRDLGIPSPYVGALAMVVWGRSLSEELERRLGAGEDPNEAVKALTAELAEVLRSISAQAPDAE